MITRRVFEQLDFESIYANAIAAKTTDDAKIPIIAADEEEALRIAIKVLSGVDRENLKIAKIKNTLELEIFKFLRVCLTMCRVKLIWRYRPYQRACLTL